MTGILYIDGNFTVPQPCSEPILTQPLPGVKDFLLLRQDFVQFGPNAISSAGNFSPLALNTIYGYDFTSPNTSLFANYFLTAESPLVDIGSGLVRWTRTYCSKPSTRYEAASLRYMFPGYNTAYVSGGATFFVTGRLPGEQIANSLQQYDYFLVGSAGAGLAAPDYASILNIPVISRQRWGYNAFNGAFNIGFVDITPPTLWDAGLSSIFPNGTVGTYLGGASMTAAAYLALVAAGGTFVAEDSIISRWQGNIFQRVTKNIQAK